MIVTIDLKQLKIDLFTTKKGAADHLGITFKTIQSILTGGNFWKNYFITEAKPNKCKKGKS